MIVVIFFFANVRMKLIRKVFELFAVFNNGKAEYAHSLITAGATDSQPVVEAESKELNPRAHQFLRDRSISLFKIFYRYKYLN